MKLVQTRAPGLETRERRESRSVQLQEQLSREIVDGTLAPGTRLEEQALADRFGVSRTPVREALQALASTGLVQRASGRGMIVATVTQSRLHDMFEVMADLEALCAGYCAKRMTVAERAALEEIHQGSRALVADGDPAGYAEVNTAFHVAIYQGAHNDYLEEMAQITRSRLAPFRGAQFRLESRLQNSFTEHDEIVTAILRGDMAGARRAMISHVEVVGEASEYFTL